MVGGLEMRVGDLEKTVEKIDKKLGVQVEEGIWQKVREGFGIQHASQFTTHSIVDLVTMLRKPFLWKCALKSECTDPHILCNGISLSVVEFLVKREVPLKPSCRHVTEIKTETARYRSA
jgi:hypothetical protein